MGKLLTILSLIGLWSMAAMGQPEPDFLNKTWNTGVFAPENVRAFLEYKHLDLFYNDCEMWTDTFAWDSDQPVEYCDGVAPSCLTDRDGVLESCQRDSHPSIRNGNETLLPGSTPWPYYPEVTWSGKTSICQDVGQDVGFGPLTPTCFTFTMLEKMVESPNKTFGLATVSTRGFYTIDLGACPGYEDKLICNDNVITNSDGVPAPMVDLESTPEEDASGAHSSVALSEVSFVSSLIIMACVLA